MKIEELNKREPKPVMLARLMLKALGNPHQVSVSEALEFRREQYGLTCHEFAGLLMLAPSHYSEIVNKKRSLPINATKRAFAIGVPFDVLLAQNHEADK